jgi:glycosyltransferase, family 1
MAKIFVFPSLYEGFGMPVLEAMACGIPVITSNVASLPEVVGEAGILVDPLNEKEIVEAYDRILSDEDLKREMVKKGIGQSKKFQWKESAKVLEKIYDEL